VKVKAACLEVFSQAQRYLADRIAECSDALAGLEPPAWRRWKAAVGEGGKFLELEGRYLNISIAGSRRDKKPTPQFQVLSGRYIELGDLKVLDFDWVGLAWARVMSDGDLSVGQRVIDSRPLVDSPVCQHDCTAHTSGGDAAMDGGDLCELTRDSAAGDGAFRPHLGDLLGLRHGQ